MLAFLFGLANLRASTDWQKSLPKLKRRMFRIRTIRFLILALAFPMLMPAGSAFASLMSASSPDAVELNCGSTNSAPTPEAPGDQRPSLWNLIYGLSGSVESSTNSTNSHVPNGHCNSVCCFLPDQQSNELCLNEFQFVPEAEPDARDKPPKSPIV